MGWGVGCDAWAQGSALRWEGGCVWFALVQDEGPTPRAPGLGMAASTVQPIRIVMIGDSPHKSQGN